MPRDVQALAVVVVPWSVSFQTRYRSS